MKNVKNKNIQNSIQKITDTIIKNYQPEKIILFGSVVAGEMRKDSDLDFVLIKETKKRFYDRIGEALKIVRSITPKPPIDFLVYTPYEFEEMTTNNYFVRNEITKKGKVLYERK